MAEPKEHIELKYLKGGFSVEPTQNGGFVILFGGRGSGLIGETASFTTPDDMLAWLTSGVAKLKAERANG